MAFEADLAQEPAVLTGVRADIEDAVDPLGGEDICQVSRKTVVRISELYDVVARPIDDFRGLCVSYRHYLYDFHVWIRAGVTL